jgi:hypothetical protein
MSYFNSCQFYYTTHFTILERCSSPDVATMIYVIVPARGSTFCHRCLLALSSFVSFPQPSSYLVPLTRRDFETTLASPLPPPSIPSTPPSLTITRWTLAPFASATCAGTRGRSSSSTPATMTKVLKFRSHHNPGLTDDYWRSRLQRMFLPRSHHNPGHSDVD